MKDSTKAYLTFTPKSFILDAKLRRCSLAAQGLWLQLETLMHLATPIGELRRTDGNPMGDKDIAEEIGQDEDEIKTLLDELEDARCLSIGDDGLLFNLLLVRARELSETRKIAGSKGGRKTMSMRLSKNADGSINTTTQLGLDVESKGQASVSGKESTKPLESFKREFNSSPKDSNILLTGWAIWVRVWRESNVYDGDPPALGPDTRAAKDIMKQTTSTGELAELFKLYLSDDDQFLAKNAHALRLLQQRVPLYRRKMLRPNTGRDGANRSQYEAKTRTVRRDRHR